MSEVLVQYNERLNKFISLKLIRLSSQLVHEYHLNSIGEGVNIPTVVDNQDSIVT